MQMRCILCRTLPPLMVLWPHLLVPWRNGLGKEAESKRSLKITKMPI